MTSARKGNLLHLPSIPHLEGIVNGQLGERNMAPRSFGIGTGSHLSNVGAHNAVWSVVNLSSVGDLANVPVQHSLGEVPVSCELVDWDNPATPGTFLIARPVSRSSWTPGECRVAISVVSGSAVGTQARFRVWGA